MNRILVLLAGIATVVFPFARVHVPGRGGYLAESRNDPSTATGGPSPNACRQATLDQGYEGSCLQAIDRFAWAVLPKLRKVTLAEARSLGTLKAESVREVAVGGGAAQEPRIHRLEFDGLILEGRVEANDRYMVHLIEVAGTRWPIRGPGIGTLATEIIGLWGAKDCRREGPLLRCQGMTETVEFDLVGEEVRRLRIKLYVG